jgi:hypothetical protein
MKPVPPNMVTPPMVMTGYHTPGIGIRGDVDHTRLMTPRFDQSAGHGGALARQSLLSAALRTKMAPDKPKGRHRSRRGKCLGATLWRRG